MVPWLLSEESFRNLSFKFVKKKICNKCQHIFASINIKVENKHVKSLARTAFSMSTIWKVFFNCILLKLEGKSDHKYHKIRELGVKVFTSKISERTAFFQINYP